MTKRILLGAMCIWLTACGSLMVHESKSPYDFDKTVATIVTNLEAEGWSMPKQYNIQKMLLDKGKKDIGKMKLIKLCNANYAEAMLSSDDSKFVSVMIPCSISIYEKTDGHTYVATMNMGLMKHLFGGNIGETLGKVAEADEKILKFLN